MAKFIVNEDFQFRGLVRRAGAVLNVSDALVEQQAKLGFHQEKKEKPLSGLLNHCSPADDETAAFVSKALGKKVATAKKPDEEKPDDPEAIEAIQKEFTDLGLAFDRRWQLKRLKNELIKAKKEKGL